MWEGRTSTRNSRDQREHGSFLLMYGEGKIVVQLANATCRKEKALGKEGVLIFCFIRIILIYYLLINWAQDNINILLAFESSSEGWDTEQVSGEWKEKKSGRERLTHPSPPPLYSQVLSAITLLPSALRSLPLISSSSCSHLLPATLRGAPLPAPGLVPSSSLTFMGGPWGYPKLSKQQQVASVFGSRL